MVFLLLVRVEFRCGVDTVRHYSVLTGISHPCTNSWEKSMFSITEFFMSERGC